MYELNVLQTPPSGYTDILKQASTRYEIAEVEPDYLYLECRALTVGIPNANGDLFTLDELKRIHHAAQVPVYKTFVGKGVYINHDAKLPQNSIGVILDAELIEDEKDPHVRLLIGIDRRKASDIVEGIMRGRIHSVSMGCSITHSICTYCGKKIISEHDLCDCLKYHRGEIINGRVIAEELHGVEFREISIVSVPADYRAKLINALNAEDLTIREAAPRDLVVRLYKRIYNASLEEKKQLLQELEELLKALSASV